MITKDFSALTDHTSVSPASSLQTWGLEFGLLAGESNTHNIQSIVYENGFDADVNPLPSARLLGRLTFPHSLTLEVSGLPQISISGLAVSMWSAGLQWTFTDEVWPINWFDAALKIKYAQSALSFSQIINNASTGGNPVAADVRFQDVVYGVELFVSKTFSIFEPYLSFGYAEGDGDLSVDAGGGATVFSPAFTAAQSGRANSENWQGRLGFSVYPFPFFVLGGEYARAFDADSWTAKLSFQFD